MNRSYALHLMSEILGALHRLRLDKNPIKTDFTPLGTTCVVEYRGLVYKISVERVLMDQPTGEMACAG